MNVSCPTKVVCSEPVELISNSRVLPGVLINPGQVTSAHNRFFSCQMSGFLFHLWETEYQASASGWIGLSLKWYSGFYFPCRQ